jgi:thiamine-phosphate diphosphorylase
MRREWQRPVLCLITDRRRLAATLAQSEHDASWLLASQIDGAIRGGADVVQIRERDLDARMLVQVVQAAMAAASRSRVVVVVNDRVDVAIAAPSSGVHLREDGVPNHVARQLLGEAQVIGRSVHDDASVAAGLDADYLIAGSVFETSSKPGATSRLGLEGCGRSSSAPGPALCGQLAVSHRSVQVKLRKPGLPALPPSRCSFRFVVRRSSPVRYKT